MTNKPQVYSTSLTKVNDTFFPMIQEQLQGNGLVMTDYAKQCVLSALSAINNVLEAKGINWNDQQLDKSNVTQNLLTVASLQLNAAANPREVYFQTRNVKFNGGWKTQVEMGIEGDGNDAILSRFGRDVKEVKQFWEVREGDKFTYPEFNGIELTPPRWSPTGQGKVIRVVYPIVRENGTVDYHIAEREHVVKNLAAHIKNNMMNETFGIAKSRYDATSEQKRQIDEKKQEIMNQLVGRDLDSILDDTGLQKYISPAWKDPQSRESMIIRKMRNNITKKIPKNFENAFVQLQYAEQDEDFQRVRKEVQENANAEVLEMPQEEPQQEQQESSAAKEEPEVTDSEVFDHEPAEEESEEVVQEERKVPFL
ncbi:hypothetical protein [Listeria ilorinensis]|uniref:hypothetical protein n=1 Tax=Listeria ilorinensis TaxID=2867439 RepID=UPI001EF53E90|nr:hypothetical protein [Listeria ilorinensis]